jgi:nitric-oxide synthase, bacterial
VLPMVERTMLDEARELIQLIGLETGRDVRSRLTDIEAELTRSGTYRHTVDELEHGSRVAWRNNTRCIARFHWRTLQVRDMRDLEHEDQVFDAIVEHLRLSTNRGRIRPLITVFPPHQPGGDGWRIWNPQLIRYAGHRQPDGSIVGDPANARLTDALRTMGWRGGRGEAFDILPLAIQKPGHAPRLFELPGDAVLEVPLSHPELPWFAELGLRWHALPAISDMRLEIGGVSYTAAPFSGWYMGTEIGARDLSDVRRYNVLPVIAERMGLSTRTDRSLWKDRALVELNVAVLHSFARCGVAMVDHHTACRQFIFHERRERQADRVVPAEWSWMVPPISASTTPVFHHAYFPDVTIKPNFFYQSKPWRTA